MPCGWITTMLETITPGHRDLQKILIIIPDIGYNRDDSMSNARIEAAEAARPGMRWLDLVQLWETRSIRTEIVCPRGEVADGLDWGKILLLETRKIMEVILEGPSGSN
jgi:hypothetical protein